MTAAIIILSVLLTLALLAAFCFRAALDWEKRLIAEREFEVSEKERALKAQAKSIEDLQAARRFTVPPATAEWTAEDVSIWRKFLGEPTGRRLVEICGGHALQEAMKECQGDKGAPQASGMDAMLRFQFNLASDALRETISGGSADQDSKTAEREQDAAQPVEIRRSF